MSFAGKTYLKINFQIAFTIKPRTLRVQIIQRKKPKKQFYTSIAKLLSW